MKDNIEISRKAPIDWKTWADFAQRYNLVMLNEAPNLVHRDNKSYDEGVLNEWLESHTCDNEDENDDCTCEPFQWYAMGISEHTCEWLNENFALDIFYSDILGLHILPVYHFGTAWTHVDLPMNKITN